MTDPNHEPLGQGSPLGEAGTPNWIAVVVNYPSWVAIDHSCVYWWRHYGEISPALVAAICRRRSRDTLRPATPKV